MLPTQKFLRFALRQMTTGQTGKLITLSRRAFLSLALVLISKPGRAATPVKTAAELVAAVRAGAEGATITIAAGTFKLDAPLELKAGMTLKGAGIHKTILTHTPNRKPPPTTLPDPEMTMEGLDANAYLIRLQRDSAGITISDMTLYAPQLHGAIFGWFNANLHLHHLNIKETLWSGIRTFGMTRAKIHDCEFRDTGGRWDKGTPGVKGGLTGGAIFAVWMSDCEIWNNRFIRTRMQPEREFYGIKVRQGIRCRMHHNTIGANFSMEFPFENDEDVEIDHNVCYGTLSIPKYAGGIVPKSGRTFHIHHNWLKDSYAIEFVRNGVEIDHNLFDFDLKADHGNLITGFGNVPAKGPASFHNNLVNNPGRGVVWMNEVFNNLMVRNNQIIARKTATPRTEGLFGFNPASDFKTITIQDNVIICEGLPRPLLRSPESYAAKVENNTLANVSDAQKLKNAKTSRPVGLEQPLRFQCGVKGEFTVAGWTVKPT
jgi:Right handed beta helix region